VSDLLDSFSSHLVVEEKRNRWVSGCCEREIEWDWGRDKQTFGDE